MVSGIKGSKLSFLVKLCSLLWAFSRSFDSFWFSLAPSQVKLCLEGEDENWFVVSKLSFCLSSGEGELQHGARFLLHYFLVEMGMRMRMRWGMMMNEIFPLKMFIAELKLKKANITSTTKRMHGMRIFTIMFIVRRNRANADVGTPQHKWKHFSTTTIPLSRKRLRRGGGEYLHIQSTRLQVCAKYFFIYSKM